ncbi:MAG: hypothetical protein SCM11_08335 [Bacillota bacterium]|nr:hypothetical protein [Bacillota bacterium]
MKSRRFRKSITILTILAMLFLLLPMAVMADEEGEGAKKALPSQASARAHWVHANKPAKDQNPDVTELEEEEEEMDEPSERALFVAERNRQAKEWGLPPGFVNIFDKLAALTDETREEIYTRFIDTESPMWIKDLAMEIKEARMMVETEADLPVEQ